MFYMLFIIEIGILKWVLRNGESHLLASTLAYMN